MAAPLQKNWIHSFVGIGGKPTDDLITTKSRKTENTKRRKLWLIQNLPHSIARVTRALKPSNHLLANAPNAAKSKKSFQMNLIVRIPAPSATNPSTFRNVKWTAKVKALRHADGSLRNRQPENQHT
jgi:hypothetical protein